MNGNLIRAGAIAAALTALMVGTVHADNYPQATPSLPPVTSPGGSKALPPMPPPPPPPPGSQGNNSGELQQPGMDSNMQMPQGSDMPGMNSDMNSPPPGGNMQDSGSGMRGQPPGMNGGRSNAPMSAPPGGGTMAPPSGAPGAVGGPQSSKRTPIVKQKTQVSKKR